MEPVPHLADPTDMMALVTGIVAGLEFIHGSGFLHLDLKPGNVLLSHRNGEYQPKVAVLIICRILESIYISKIIYELFPI